MASTRTTLKGYFNAGDEPTEAQFGELIDGLVSIQDTNHVTGSIRTSGGINITPEILTPAASVTITAAQAGKLLLIGSTATANDEYVLPIPTFIGQTYRFAWNGIAADGDDILWVAPSADAWTMTGGFLYFDTDATDAGGYLMQFPGADDDNFQVTDPEGFDIQFTATTLTNYHITGYLMSTGTAGLTFGDL
jgi:hypothetical protein